MDEVNQTQQGFTQRRLPWVLAAVMLVFYLVTLSYWPTFSSVAALARVNGMDWRPTYVAPVYYLATLPLRWLPDGLQLLALNLFEVACSVLSLTLLARAVALLPHDRTKDQRLHELSDYSFLTIPAAWLPPVFAVAICGLQLTFWEHTVGASPECLDLLLFAYVVRCLLEFRIGERDAWLYRAGLVFALGMTNNLAMVAMLPCFLIAVVWIKGLAFFRWEFLSRMALCAALGLSFYLLLPVIHTAAESSTLTFWEMLRTNLGFQINAIRGFPRYLLLFISLSSLLPVLFIGIRWPSMVGDISSAGVALSNLMTHVLHGLFLVYCTLVAFDPPFSPRNISMGFGWSFLPMYFLGALNAGYCLGYFLLVFGTPADPKSFVRPSPLRQVFNKLVVAAAWLVAVAGPVGLLVMNYPLVRLTSGRAFSDYTEAAARLLPSQGAVVMSDDPLRLYALDVALKKSGQSDRFILVDTRSLPSPGYHRALKHRYGERWPGLGHQRALTETIDQPSLVLLMDYVAQSNFVYYLHPSFGYYFERFYQKPEGLVYKMELLGTNDVSGPVLSDGELKRNDTIWKELLNGKLRNLRSQIQRQATERESRRDLAALYLGGMYSRALDAFGVEAQRADKLPLAAEYFGLALAFNTNNPSAFINLDYNKLLQAGKRDNPEPSDGVKKRLFNYGGNWEAILNYNGPVDEPYACFLLAQALARGRNYRQAASNLRRTLHYLPDNFVARLALANACVRGGIPREAFRITTALRAAYHGKSLPAVDEVALIQTEAYAHAGQGDLEGAVKLLTDAQQRFPDQDAPFSTLSELYLANRHLTNAVLVLEQQLKLQPKNVSALNNYGHLLMREGRNADALAPLTQALALQPVHPEALLNRAIANLQIGKLEESRTDYEALQNALPRPSYAVYYGLGEIAFRQKKVRTALRNFNRFLEFAPEGVPEIEQVRQRIRALKSGKF